MTRPSYPGEPEPIYQPGGHPWMDVPGPGMPGPYQDVPAPAASPPPGQQGRQRLPPGQQRQLAESWRRVPPWQRAVAAGVVAVLLVGAGVLIGWRATMADTFRALRVVHGVPAGGKLNPGDLETIEVPADLIDKFLPARRTQKVLGKTAKVDLRAGTLLRRHQLSNAKGLPKPGQVEVGLALKPGQVPADGLGVGDKVRVVAGVTTGSGVEGVMVAGGALVYEVRVRGSNVRVTLLVGRAAADRIGAYAQHAAISLVRTDRGGGGPDKPVVWDARPSEKPKGPGARASGPRKPGAGRDGPDGRAGQDKPGERGGRDGSGGRDTGPGRDGPGGSAGPAGPSGRDAGGGANQPSRS